MTVASFLGINARQSLRAALCWLAPTLKGAFVQERNMRCLHRTQEPDEHLAHAVEQLRQLVENLAAAQILDVVDHHLDTQHTSALVVDLQRQISPFDLEHSQIITARLHGLDHRHRLASPLWSVMRAMRETEDGLDLLQIQRRAGTADTLLFLVGERKAKAGGVDPSLAKLAQSTDDVLLMQSRRETIDRGKITAL